MEEEGEIRSQSREQKRKNTGGSPSPYRNSKKDKKDKKSKKDKRYSRSRSRSQQKKKNANKSSPQQQKRGGSRSLSPSKKNKKRQQQQYSPSPQKSRRYSRSRSPKRKRSRSPRRKQYSRSPKRKSSYSPSRKDRKKREKSSKRDKKSKKRRDSREYQQQQQKEQKVVMGEFVEQQQEDEEELDINIDDNLLKNIGKNNSNLQEDDDEAKRAAQRAALFQQFNNNNENQETKDQQNSNQQSENDQEDESDSENNVVMRKIDDKRMDFLKQLDRKNSELEKNKDIKSEEEEEDEKQQNEEEDEEDDEKEEEEFDMFNMDMSADQAQLPVKEEQAIYDQHEYDDAENYLKIRTGELIGDNRYKVVKKMGKGVFASVCEALDTVEGKNVAIKILRNEEIMIQSGEKEAKILQLLNENDRFNKRHIVKLLRTFEHRRHLCLVFELLDMNLRETIKHYGKMKLDHIKSYGLQLFKALAHMKKHKIIHADIKPDNILITKDTKEVKMCDLGTAFYVEEAALVQYMVSRFYRAPEIIIGYPYDYGIDVWSVACTLYEMYTGEFAFTGGNNSELLRDQLQKRGKIKPRLLKKGQFIEKFFDVNQNFLSQEYDTVLKKHYVKTINFGIQPVKQMLNMPANLPNQEEIKKFNLFKDLIEKCLNMDPKLRLQPEKALEHPFFSNNNNNAQKKN